jgi:hypothetical protein
MLIADLKSDSVSFHNKLDQLDINPLTPTPGVTGRNSLNYGNIVQILHMQ